LTEHIEIREGVVGGPTTAVLAVGSNLTGGSSTIRLHCEQKNTHESHRASL